MIQLVSEKTKFLAYGGMTLIFAAIVQPGTELGLIGMAMIAIAYISDENLRRMF